MFLTHRDDVADHAKWSTHFNATRVMHRDDIGRSITGVEHVLTGSEAVRLASDLIAIPTAGHTRGHTVLLYRDRYLFSGDHIWWSDELASLAASSRVCWYSWTEQIRSVERLLDYEFEWVLPGHGRRVHLEPQIMGKHLHMCLERMKARSGRVAS